MARPPIHWLCTAFLAVAVVGQLHNTTTTKNLATQTQIHRSEDADTEISSAARATRTLKGSPWRGGGKFVGAPHADPEEATQGTHLHGHGESSWTPTAVITVPATFTDARTIAKGHGYAVLELATVARAFGGPDGWQESIAVTYQINSPLATPAAGASESVQLTLMFGNWMPVLTLSAGVGEQWVQQEKETGTSEEPWDSGTVVQTAHKETMTRQTLTGVEGLVTKSLPIAAPSSWTPEPESAPLQMSTPTPEPERVSTAREETQWHSSTVVAPVASESRQSPTATTPIDSRTPDISSEFPTDLIPPSPNGDFEALPPLPFPTGDGSGSGPDALPPLPPPPDDSSSPLPPLLFPPDDGSNIPVIPTNSNRLATVPIILGALLGSALIAFLIWWFAYYRQTAGYRARKVQRKDEAFELAVLKRRRAEEERKRREDEREKRGVGRERRRLGLWDVDVSSDEEDEGEEREEERGSGSAGGSGSGSGSKRSKGSSGTGTIGPRIEGKRPGSPVWGCRGEQVLRSDVEVDAIEVVTERPQSKPWTMPL